MYFHLTLVTLILIISCLISLAQETVKILSGHSKSVFSLSFSSDGKYLASVSSDKTMIIWNVETGEALHTLSDENAEGEISACFSPDGKTLISGSWDKNVKTWDVETGKLKRVLQGHTQSLRTVSYSPEINKAASAGWDNDIIIWHVSSGTIFNVLKGHLECVRSIDYSPDGKYIASGGYDKELKIWDVETLKEIYSMEGHKYPIESVCYSPDGKYVATGSVDNTIKIWDALKGGAVKTIAAHKETVYSVSFSPDGKYLASGSYDKTVKIWDVNTAQNIATFNGHSLSVKAVCFSPDGKYLASASDDGTIRIWDVSYLHIVSDVSKKTILSKEIQPGKSIISWINPVKKENSDHEIEVYERDYTIKASINNVAFDEVKLYVNGKEYAIYNGADVKHIEPKIQKTEQNISVSYDLYLYEGNNNIQLYVKNKNGNYAFSEMINVFYRDISKQAEGSNLYVFNLNIPSYVDKKVNACYSNYNSDEFINLLKTQQAKLFGMVFVQELNTLETTTKIDIENTFNSFIKNIKADDMLFIILSSCMVQDPMNYYIVPSDVEKDAIVESMVNVKLFTEEIKKHSFFTAVFYNSSYKLGETLEGFSDFDPNTLLNFFIIELGKKPGGGYCLQFNDKNIYNALAKGLDRNSDTNKNKVVSLNEFNEYLKANYSINSNVHSGDIPFMLYLNLQ